MNWVLKLSDKLLFTATFVLAMQLPEFIHQYRQRLGGHLDEARNQLASYQVVADKNFQGDLNLLVAQYQNSASAAFRDTGAIVSDLIHRVEYLQEISSRLHFTSLPEKLWVLITHLDSEIASRTLDVYEPGLPLTLQALFCGFLGAGFVSICFGGCAHACKKVLESRQRHRIKQHLSR